MRAGTNHRSGTASTSSSPGRRRILLAGVSTSRPVERRRRMRQHAARSPLVGHRCLRCAPTRGPAKWLSGGRPLRRKRRSRVARPADRVRRRRKHRPRRDLGREALQAGRRQVVAEDRGCRCVDAVADQLLPSAAWVCDRVTDGAAARALRHDRLERGRMVRVVFIRPPLAREAVIFPGPAGKRPLVLGRSLPLGKALR